MKNKLKILLRAVAVIVCLCAFNDATAQYISFSYKGQWSDWESIRPKDAPMWAKGIEVLRSPNKSGLALTFGGQIVFAFQIKYFLIPDKKARKACLESGKWYEYKTTIEYYVNDQYPNAEAFARVNKLVVPNTRTDRTPCVKKTSECIVKIAPYKKEPELWNIFFYGIGVAISTNGMKFKD